MYYKERFHSFEVGFGLRMSFLIPFSFTGFHSFEVGFGRRVQRMLTMIEEGFHSFEVGFGPGRWWGIINRST